VTAMEMATVTANTTETMMVVALAAAMATKKIQPPQLLGALTIIKYN
jgi:hypothetical protein